jgi:hypothetical protein
MTTCNALTSALLLYVYYACHIYSTSPWSQAIVAGAEYLLIRSLGIENEDKFLLSHCGIQHMSPSGLHTLCFT